MGLLPPDFESGAYTNFATQARTLDNKTLHSERQEQPRVFGIADAKTTFRKIKILQRSGCLWLNFCGQNNSIYFDFSDLISAYFKL
jgi:hypothetical protein